MRILVLTGSLFFNRINWLDEIGKTADVTVLYCDKEDSESDSRNLNTLANNIKIQYIKGLHLPKIGSLTFGFIKELKKRQSEYDIIMLDGYGFLSQLINIRYLNRHKIRYFVNVDGVHDNEKESKIKQKLKTKLISSIPYFLCGADQAKTVLMKYGAKEETIYHHVFTSLYRKDIFEAPVGDEQRNEIKKELGIQEDFVVISVGRFSYLNGYGKGYDVLIKAAKKMSKQIGWYIVGGEPTNEFAELAKNVPNVHFEDFQGREELKKYYQASDLFVLMSIGEAWGLVVNESMACGLPVITTDRCIAGCELIKNGENGFLLQVGDVEGLIEKVNFLYSNRAKRAEMGHTALADIRNYTIENMAFETLNAFRLTLGVTDHEDGNQ